MLNDEIEELVKKYCPEEEEANYGKATDADERRD